MGFKIADHRPNKRYVHPLHGFLGEVPVFTLVYVESLRNELIKIAATLGEVSKRATIEAMIPAFASSKATVEWLSVVEEDGTTPEPTPEKVEAFLRELVAQGGEDIVDRLFQNATSVNNFRRLPPTAAETLGKP